MRALKFLGVFLGTLIVVLFIVFGFRMDALITLLQNKEGIQEGQEWVARTSSLKGLTEYIGAQPRRVSIASYAVGTRDSSILYNQHTPRTMGRLANLFFLIEYARQVEKGTLDPNQQIPIERVNRYQLPYINHSDHQNALSALRERQKISEQQTVALHDLIQASVIFNDVAIADFLLFKLGIDNLNALMDQLAIKETELPLPFSGLYITLNPHLKQVSFTALLDSLSLLPRKQFKKSVFKKTDHFLNDKAYREKVLSTFEEHNGLDIPFARQRDALALFPKTTAAEMGRLIKQIQQEKLLSAAVSKTVKQFLQWPLNRSKQLEKYFKTYGALYDSRMGMINGINFGIPAESDQPFAQALFFDDLQIGFWFHMSSNMMHLDFQQRLIWDAALRGATRQAIQDTNATYSSSES